MLLSNILAVLQNRSGLRLVLLQLPHTRLLSLLRLLLQKLHYPLRKRMRFVAAVLPFILPLAHHMLLTTTSLIYNH